MKLRSSRPLTSLPVPEVRTGPLRPLTSSGSASLVRLESGADLGVEGGGENGHLLGGVNSFVTEIGALSPFATEIAFHLAGFLLGRAPRRREQRRGRDLR